jgi:hypothetical protein
VLTPGSDPNGFPTLQGAFTFIPLIPQAIYAEYSGDSNYSAAISVPTIVEVDFPDFDVSTTPPDATVNVSQGGAAQIALQITYLFGYTFTGTGTAQLTITTTAPQAAARKGSGIARGIGWTAGFSIMACAFLAGASSGHRRWRAFLSLVVVGFLLTLPSCGGGGSGTGGGGGGGNIDPGTPKGTYVLSVNAKSGSVVHTATFQLVVQ